MPLSNHRIIVNATGIKVFRRMEGVDMPTIYNIYCDESCHLEHDHIPVMVLGAVWCMKNSVREVSEMIRELKSKHNLSKGFEIKWTKVSPSKLSFYEEIIAYFFAEPRLHFRGLIIPDKGKLNHAAFMQNHDEWYYKMFFVLIKQILTPQDRYRIYLDIKDTRSQQKVNMLHDVLCNNIYDFDKSIIEKIQHVRSHEVEILQLTDLLIGLLGYLHRGLQTSGAKMKLIESAKAISGLNLAHTTLPREDKMNLLIWNPKEW